MKVPTGLRSFNPKLANHFSKNAIPSYQYGFKNILQPELCQAVIDKLDLRLKYPNSASNLDIVDVFPGFGLFSTMLNYELKPRNHILIDSNKNLIQTWNNRIQELKATGEYPENFHLYEKDGYVWETFDQMVEVDHLIKPKIQSGDKIHDELLIVGNLTPPKFGESLLAQWIMCCGYGNWLQKYGRVRMICFTTEHTASKFTAQENYLKRNRTSAKRDTFIDIKLTAIQQALDPLNPDGQGYDPRVLVKDQPIVMPREAISTDADLAIVEMSPKGNNDLDVDLYEYILKILFFRPSLTVKDHLQSLTPGYEDEMSAKLTHDILQKKSKELSVFELKQIYDLVYNWPFKPTYEDFISVFDIDGKK